jgi:ABC-2 type transport system ATP-binding protein
LNDVRQHYLVSSTARRSDGTHVRVVSDISPASTAVKSLPTLEEAYLYLIEGAKYAEKMEPG